VPTNYVTFPGIQRWKLSEKDAKDWYSESNKQTADTIITPSRTNVGLTVQKKNQCSVVCAQIKSRGHKTPKTADENKTGYTHTALINWKKTDVVLTGF
jgi:poly(3-hydroxybutyrate) depolymerase